MAEDTEHRGSSKFERWVDHIARGLTVAAILGVGVVLSDLRTDVAVLAARVEDIRTDSADRYTRSDAERDITPLQNRVADNELRIRQLERGEQTPP